MVAQNITSGILNMIDWPWVVMKTSRMDLDEEVWMGPSSMVMTLTSRELSTRTRGSKVLLTLDATVAVNRHADQGDGLRRQERGPLLQRASRCDAAGDPGQGAGVHPRERIGNVEGGKDADLLVIHGHPFDYHVLRELVIVDTK